MVDASVEKKITGLPADFPFQVGDLENIMKNTSCFFWTAWLEYTTVRETIKFVGETAFFKY